MHYQKSTTIKIGKEVYQASYPNVGQQLEIENLKNVLTKGKYAEIAIGNSKTGGQLLDLVDATAYFGVLVPELKETCSIANFGKIDVVLQRRLSKAFIKFYNEFILKVEAEINRMLDSEELEKEEEETEQA